MGIFLEHSFYLETGKPILHEEHELYYSLDGQAGVDCKDETGVSS